MANPQGTSEPEYDAARGQEGGAPPLFGSAWPQQRFIWLGAGVLALALVVLGALVILSSSRGPEAPRDLADVPVIHAEEKPFKVRPENPGGMDIPHQDKLIYQRLRGEERPIKVERLLSEPEKPLPPPAPPPPEEKPAEAAEPASGDPGAMSAEAIARSIVERGLIQQPGAAPTIMGVDEGMVPGEATGGKAAAAAPIPVPRPRPPQRAAETAALSPPTAAPSAPAPSAPAPSAAAAPAAPAAAAPTVAAPALPPATNLGGSFRIQLGAFATPEKVDAEWRRLQAQHRALLGALKPESSRVELPDRSALFRLRAGPLDGEDRARALCQDLVRRGAGCLVVPPRG